MKTTVINRENELKDFVSKNRKNITNINGVQFGELYPMIEVTNRYVSYYDAEYQGNKFLYRPFNIELKKQLVKPKTMNKLTDIEFTRVNNDVNGNGRVVVHFLEFLTKNEIDRAPVSELYKLAVKKAKKIGGRKYRAKSYGGGIVFQWCESLEKLEQLIINNR